jgi:hypothetical protein
MTAPMPPRDIDPEDYDYLGTELRRLWPPAERDAPGAESVRDAADRIADKIQVAEARYVELSACDRGDRAETGEKANQRRIRRLQVMRFLASEEQALARAWQLVTGETWPHELTGR